MKRVFIIISNVFLLFILFCSRHVFTKETIKPAPKNEIEELLVDIDHSKQLDDDTDINSILVMIDKDRDLDIDDIKDINVINIKDLTYFPENDEHVHRIDCIHSNKEQSIKILKMELVDGGKENILDAISKITEYDGVLYAEPNYKGSFFHTFLMMLIWKPIGTYKK